MDAYYSQGIRTGPPPPSNVLPYLSSLHRLSLLYCWLLSFARVLDLGFLTRIKASRIVEPAPLSLEEIERDLERFFRPRLPGEQWLVQRIHEIYDIYEPFRDFYRGFFTG